MAAKGFKPTNNIKGKKHTVILDADIYYVAYHKTNELPYYACMIEEYLESNRIPENYIRCFIIGTREDDELKIKYKRPFVNKLIQELEFIDLKKL